MSKILYKYGLIILLVISAVPRLIGIDHGFPYIFHPDEPAVVRSALGIRFDPNPGHFDWPHLYFYMNYFLFMVFAKLRDIIESIGAKNFMSAISPIVWNDNLVFYLISRLLSATLGIATIIPLYKWLSKHLELIPSFVICIFFALMPFHIRASHYALIDVPMLFFLVLALYFSDRYPSVSGLLLGFSISTKYNGIFGILFILTLYLVNKRKVTDFIKVCLFSCLGFFIGTPYSILDFSTFIQTDNPNGALWQFTNVGRETLGKQITNFVQSIYVKLSDDFGYGTSILAVIGFLTALLKKNKLVTAFSLITMLLIFYISGGKRNPSHYYLPIYPAVILIAGYTIKEVLQKLQASKHKVLSILLLALFLIPSVILSYTNIKDITTRTSDKVYGGEIFPDRIDVNEKVN